MSIADAAFARARAKAAARRACEALLKDLDGAVRVDVLTEILLGLIEDADSTSAPPPLFPPPPLYILIQEGGRQTDQVSFAALRSSFDNILTMDRVVGIEALGVGGSYSFNSPSRGDVTVRRTR